MKYVYVTQVSEVAICMPMLVWSLPGWNRFASRYPSSLVFTTLGVVWHLSEIENGVLMYWPSGQLSRPGYVCNKRNNYLVRCGNSS